MEQVSTIRLRHGDFVRRVHPWDGSREAGTPVGPLLSVRKVHPLEPVAVCELSDGRSEFECNLERFEIDLR
jgi:hypothetical protein